MDRGSSPFSRRLRALTSRTEEDPASEQGAAREPEPGEPQTDEQPTGEFPAVSSTPAPTPPPPRYEVPDDTVWPAVSGPPAAEDVAPANEPATIEWRAIDTQTGPSLAPPSIPAPLSDPPQAADASPPSDPPTVAAPADQASAPDAFQPAPTETPPDAVASPEPESDSEPEPAESAPEPEAFTAHQPDPQPAAHEPDPQPAAYEPDPQPPAYEPDPQPPAYEPDPQPAAESPDAETPAPTTPDEAYATPAAVAAPQPQPEASSETQQTATWEAIPAPDEEDDERPRGLRSLWSKLPGRKPAGDADIARFDSGEERRPTPLDPADAPPKAEQPTSMWASPAAVPAYEPTTEPGPVAEPEPQPTPPSETPATDGTSGPHLTADDTDTPKPRPRGLSGLLRRRTQDAAEQPTPAASEPGHDATDDQTGAPPQSAATQQPDPYTTASGGVWPTAAAAEAMTEKPSFAERATLRRRAKSLRARRDAGLLELGAIVLDQRRFGDASGGALTRKRTDELVDLDNELAEIEIAIAEDRPMTAVEAVGVTRCGHCTALLGPLDAFCAQCGAARDTGSSSES